MKSCFTVFLSLALCLLAASDSTTELRLLGSDSSGADRLTKSTAVYDPSSSYQGIAVVEVWLSQQPITVGDLHGAKLYHQVHAALHSLCTFAINGKPYTLKRQQLFLKTTYSAGRNQVRSGTSALPCSPQRGTR